MKTKTFFLITLMFAFLLTHSTKADSQALDQYKLLKQLVGTWRANISKDTVEIWVGSRYGKGIILSSSYIIKGVKSPLFKNTICLDSTGRILMGFVLWINGKHETWIGTWSTEKTISYGMVDDFNTDTGWLEVELMFGTSTPRRITKTCWEIGGAKTYERVYVKIK